MASSDQRFTPEWFIESVRAVLGRIDLDPCSCEAANRVVQATTYFTEDDDALAETSWRHRFGQKTNMPCESFDRPLKVFMNPPYSRASGGAGVFCDRLIAEWEAGNVSEAVILLNVATGTNWFQPLFRFPMCLMDRRMRFDTAPTPDGERIPVGDSPRYDNVAVYLPRADAYACHGFNENDVVAFAATFKKHGNVVVPFSMYDDADYVDPEAV